MHSKYFIIDSTPEEAIANSTYIDACSLYIHRDEILNIDDEVVSFVKMTSTRIFYFNKTFGLFVHDFLHPDPKNAKRFEYEF